MLLFSKELPIHIGKEIKARGRIPIPIAVPWPLHKPVTYSFLIICNAMTWQLFFEIASKAFATLETDVME